MELENPYILIHEEKISNVKKLIPLLEKARRLSPRDPVLFLTLFRMGFVKLMAGQQEQAVEWLLTVKGFSRETLQTGISSSPAKNWMTENWPRPGRSQM